MFWPVAHHASLVHDALYQYLNVAPISKADADELFRQLLIDNGLPRWLAGFYHWFVDHFGARDVKSVGRGCGLRLTPDQQEQLDALARSLST